MARNVTLPSLFCCFVACILLILASVSSPVWESFYFLRAGTGADKIHFGAFGYTGSGNSVGYQFPARFGDYNKGRLSSGTIHNLIGILILHPIAAGLSGLALLSGIYEASNRRLKKPSPPPFSGLAFTCTLIVWIIDMALWGIARNVLRDNGVSAQYGNANWLTLGALLALGGATGFCGVFITYN